MTTRSWIWVLAACLVWTGLTGRAAAGGSGIAVAMGDLRWGMTESEVITYVRRKIGEQYAAQIKAHPAQQSKLRDEMKRAQADVEKSRVEFEGSRSRWDSSPIAGEFNYGDDQSMVTAKSEGSQSFYFFRDGRLWKWYKALDQSQFSGGGFKKFSSSIESSFGKGRAKKGELNPNQGETQWVEYIDRNSRMRAADNSKRGVFALIFEDMSVVRELASLRPTKPSRLAGQDDDDAPPPAAKEPVKTGDSTIARAQTKRSVFASEPQQESEADYQSRKQKAAEEARERQTRAHQRKEEAKKGEVLKTLDGIDDKDPLGGL
jgi:hypothetical protein